MYVVAPFAFKTIVWPEHMFGALGDIETIGNGKTLTVIVRYLFLATQRVLF